MKIVIDLRSLSSGRVSGVENYCLNLLENLPALEKNNQYLLFYNALRRRRLPDVHYVNSKVLHTKLPNRLLNLAFKFNALNLESLVGETDWVFMPNINQIALNPKTKLAITVHDLSPFTFPEFYNFKRRLWHWFLNCKKTFNRANLLFAVSEYTKQDLIKIFNLPEHKIKVIYPGVDSKIYHPNITNESLIEARNYYNLPGEYILFLNTIEPRKNLAGLIKAFEKIKSNAHLVIAGSLGWKYKKDFDLIEKSKKRNKILYLGYVKESYKPALIKLAKSLVYPSFYEGFGFQCLEAMGVGTPVIASQLTALPEVTQDAALLVNPYDEYQMATALDELIKNESLREQLITKGFQRVQDFSWKKTAEQILVNLENYAK